jgi:hypothetical protein
MGVKGAVHEIAIAVREREQEIVLALLNRTLVRTEWGPGSPGNKAMTTPESNQTGDLEARVMTAVEASTTDFRTVQGLARDLNVSETAVREALVRLGDKVRRPVGADEEYADWVRASALPRTRQERWWGFRAVAGHTGPGS